MFMVVDKLQVESIISEIEAMNGKHFSHRQYLLLIIENCCGNELRECLNRLIFLGKFLHNTNNLMNRIGKAGEGYEKLLTEFKDNTNEVVVILNKIVDIIPLETRNEINNMVSLHTKTDFENFMRLMEDLSRLKNYELDTNRKICDEFK